VKNLAPAGFAIKIRQNLAGFGKANPVQPYKLMYILL